MSLTNSSEYPTTREWDRESARGDRERERDRDSARDRDRDYHSAVMSERRGFTRRPVARVRAATDYTA